MDATPVDMDATPVVTCFLRNGTDVLLQCRSNNVGSFPGLWAGVSGYVEEDPVETARREIDEETGLVDVVTLVRSGEPFVVDVDTRWLVHPFLFDCASRATDPNWETIETEWVPPTAILERDTVPGLWEAYRRVAPSVDSIRSDTTHGAAWISIRALEVLRDTATDPETEADVAYLADDLVGARPSMAVLANRVARVMHDASQGEDLVTAANDAIHRALDADATAAANAHSIVADQSIITLSWSGTVFEALSTGEPAAVVVAESRPDREGVETAERLDAAGIDVTLITDAAIGTMLDVVDVVLVGADSVLGDGRVVNKTGTRLAAVAAAAVDVPVYVVAALDKVAPETAPHLESGDSAAVYDGATDVSVENPRFDVTPADAITGVITENGVLTRRDIEAVAREHRALREW